MAVGAETLQVLEPGHVVHRHVTYLDSCMVNLNTCFTVFGAKNFYRVSVASLAEQAAVLSNEVCFFCPNRRRLAFTTDMLSQRLGSFGIHLGRGLVLIKVGLGYLWLHLALRENAIAGLPKESKAKRVLSC